MDNASARNLWGDYLDAHLEDAFVEAPRTLHFYDNEKDANAGIAQVRKGKKKTITHSLLGLQHRKERLPKIGDFIVFTNWEGKAECIARTTAVNLRPFFSIDERYVRLDGCTTIHDWKKLHWDYYTHELEVFGRVPRDSMIVVCQEFDLVFER